MFNLMDYSVLLCIEENPNPDKLTPVELGEEFMQQKLKVLTRRLPGHGSMRH